MRKLPPLNAVRAFEAAARHISFTKAADELRVTHGAVDPLGIFGKQKKGPSQTATKSALKTRPYPLACRPTLMVQLLLRATA